eukprot:330903-Rhodomonas_salina.2
MLRVAVAVRGCRQAVGARDAEREADDARQAAARVGSAGTRPRRVGAGCQHHAPSEAWDRIYSAQTGVVDVVLADAAGAAGENAVG